MSTPGMGVSPSDFYDEEYFERGIESGKSLYENYRWLEDATMVLAKNLLKEISSRSHNLDANSLNILDFGCAKGYLVKAFRTLNINCYGVDVSEYAIRNCHPDVNSFLHQINSQVDLPHHWPKIDWIIAKDVLEHIDYSELESILQRLRKISPQILAVIPLGDGVSYYIPEYEKDRSHFIREDLDWWLDRFSLAGFTMEGSYYVGPLKANWVENHKKGNGLFVSI